MIKKLKHDQVSDSEFVNRKKTKEMCQILKDKFMLKNGEINLKQIDKINSKMKKFKKYQGNNGGINRHYVKASFTKSNMTFVKYNSLVNVINFAEQYKENVLDARKVIVSIASDFLNEDCKPNFCEESKMSEYSNKDYSWATDKAKEKFKNNFEDYNNWYFEDEFKTEKMFNDFINEFIAEVLK